ncbi:hypothetical protein R8Z50_27375 [Longispora sp. K20-0274]|uniref:hypothetical protein n=1 Tax=Longispora sp. K20-0274 TaxID=3088255 RepID=UPI00399C06C7
MNLKLKKAMVVGAVALMSSIGVAAASGSPAAASDPGGNCSISTSGSPGLVTFTLHVSGNNCSWPVRAYAKCNDNTYRYGPTLYYTGDSKTASCPVWGLNDWGYEYWSPYYHSASMR